jgi:hypothetical protein
VSLSTLGRHGCRIARRSAATWIAPRRATPALAFVALLVAASVLAGCGGKGSPDVTNPPPPPTGSTSFSGSYASSIEHGSLAITVSTDAPAPPAGTYRAGSVVGATGTLKPVSGGTTALTGTYNDATHAVSLAGGAYTVSGGLNSYGLEGFFGAAGGSTGNWSVVTTSTPVTVYCGTFTSTSGRASGRWTLAVRGGAVHGIWIDTNGVELPLDGTLVGVNITITNPLDPPGPALANGTLVAGTMSGTYNTGGGNSGNWSATLCP